MEFVNTLEKERNLIYEPDAVATEEDNEDIKIFPEERITVSSFTVPQKIKIKNDGNNAVSITLILLSLAGFILGVAMCGVFFDALSKEYINTGLTAKIKGGFFGNAASSFITMAGWSIAAFAQGFSGVAQPAIFLLPAIKCAGTGIVLSSYIGSYGILNGLLAFSAFVLPSFVIGTLLMLYICRCAVKSSNRIFLHITERNMNTRPKEFFKDYLTKGFITIAGCFIGGIIDAAIGFICSHFFVI